MKDPQVFYVNVGDMAPEEALNRLNRVKESYRLVKSAGVNTRDPGIPRVPCTWADAERWIPGVEAEWRAKVGAKGFAMPPARYDYRVAFGKVKASDGKTDIPIATMTPIDCPSSIVPEWQCMLIKGHRVWCSMNVGSVDDDFYIPKRTK